MKKFLSLLLVVAFSAVLLVGCAGNNEAAPSPTAEQGPEVTTPVESPEATEEPAVEEPVAGGVKTGLAVTTSIAKSKDAGEKEGSAQADSVVVAVLVDAEGKIIDCVIDTAQSKAAFGADGKIITPLDTEFKTKNELGEEYGMKAASGIGKEWYEQAAALAEYVIGKTVEEVQGIAVDEKGYATDADLKASVTVNIAGYLNTIVKAVGNAQELGASETDKLGLGVVTNINKSKDATAEAEGQVQFYSFYGAVTQDADGKITSCIIDASQANVKFDATGKITSDLTAAPMTKNELKEDYGMKAASGIGKEWYEQAAAFAEYVVGKTVDEVTGIAVDEKGHATDADLTASVTISINDMQAVIAKAAK